jgi:hypothetical protein
LGGPEQWPCPPEPIKTGSIRPGPGPFGARCGTGIVTLLPARAETLTLRPRPVSRKDRLDVQAPERREHVGAEGSQGAKLEGEREHPLPYGHRGDHSIDQVGRDVGHAPARTARTDRARLAGVGHKQVVPARVAVAPHEAMREYPAAKIPPQLALDVPRQRRVVGLAGVRQGPGTPCWPSPATGIRHRNYCPATTPAHQPPQTSPPPGVRGDAISRAISSATHSATSGPPG